MCSEGLEAAVSGRDLGLQAVLTVCDPGSVAPSVVAEESTAIVLHSESMGKH